MSGECVTAQINDEAVFRGFGVSCKGSCVVEGEVFVRLIILGLIGGIG